MIPSFTIQLQQPILPGLVTIGRFDGRKPSLACATVGGKVLLHSPHEGNNNDDFSLPTVRYLNFNTNITALLAGKLSDDVNAPDILFVGTRSSLLAYDVERNADVFYKEVTDGVNTLVIGKIGNSKKPIIICGGNQVVLGFDENGDEVFWTVTGDNVSCLGCVDIDNDSKLELLVGSDDREIRIFKNEEIIGEITVADKINNLRPISNTTLGNLFAYSLANGTIGVYNSNSRPLWKLKAKNGITALHDYDLDNDGNPEIICGTNSGHFLVRSLGNGEIIYKDTMSAPIAAILSYDYKMEKLNSLIICAENGEIRGYLPVPPGVQLVPTSEDGVELASEKDSRQIEEYLKEKKSLMAELKRLDDMNKSKSTGTGNNIKFENTLTLRLEPDVDNGAVTIVVDTKTSDVVIICMILIDLDGNIVEGAEILAVYPPDKLANNAVMQLKPFKNILSKVRLQVHLATRASRDDLIVCENDIIIPMFSKFKKIEDKSMSRTPSSQVLFRLNRIQISQIYNYIRDRFLLGGSEIKYRENDKLVAYFFSVCGSNSSTDNDPNSFNGRGQPLHILVCKDDTDEHQIVVRIRCDSLDLAGDLVQDLVSELKISELESEAEFPLEMEMFDEVINNVHDNNVSRSKLAADMADDSQRIKALIIRAEDSRIMNDMQSMRMAYTELSGMNTSLISSYSIRAQNHNTLLGSLKEVNQMIQKAANLRAGKAKTLLIAECRAAVKANNLQIIKNSVKYGHKKI